MASFEAFFEKTGGRRKEEDYGTEQFNNAAGITGVASLEVVKPEVEKAEWEKLVAKSAADVSGSRNATFGSRLSEAAGAAWNALQPGDRNDIGISSNGTLIVKSKVRKALAKQYNAAPDYGVYQRLNALRFLKALSTMYSSFGRLLTDAERWKESNDYNRSDLGKVNRIYSSQIQKTRKLEYNPDYRATDQQLATAYDNAFKAYNEAPTPQNMKNLYKALGRLKFKGNASKYAGNIAGIVDFKARAKAEREKLRDEARAKAISWAQGALNAPVQAVQQVQEAPVQQMVVEAPIMPLAPPPPPPRQTKTVAQQQSEGITNEQMAMNGWTWTGLVWYK